MNESIKKIVLTSLVAVGALGILPGIVAANDMQGHDPEMAKRKVEKLTKTLELTPEQQTQVQQIVDKYGEQRKAAFEQLKSLKEQEGAEIRGTLTPEQQTKYDEWKAKRKEKMLEGKKDNRHDHKDHEHDDKDDKKEEGSEDKDD